MNFLSFLAGLLALTASPAATAGAVSPAIEQPAPRFSICGQRPTRNCVVDGDTAWIGGVKVRLDDIDAPETHQAKCNAEAVLGKRSTIRLAELMNEGPFRQVRGARDRDIHGRKLRRLMRNGRSLGDQLVAEGLARPWDGRRRGWCG